MTTLKVARSCAALALSVLLFGCSSTAVKPPPDQTPSWMKYHVTGSRIARRMDASGRPLSADFVRSTSSQGLSKLPGVAVCSPHRAGC